MRPRSVAAGLATVVAAALATLAACSGPSAPSDATLSGAALYARYCLACHQADGSAREGLRPALAGSVLVTGPVEPLARWVMYGVRDGGPVPRRYPAVMPAYAGLSDEALAQVLTHVRSYFGNHAPAVRAEDIARVRAAGGAHAG